jgi:hypothetical protein
MWTVCKAVLAGLLVCAAAVADVFTNYSLYGWSSPSWPSADSNALRGAIVKMPAFVVADGVNGGTNIWTSDVDWIGNSRSGTSFWSFIPVVPNSAGYEGAYSWLYVASNHPAAFGFNTKDRRAYEMWIALLERAACVPGFRFDDGSPSGKECDDFVPWFYRFDHRNLETYKAVIASLLPSYADVTVATNPLLPAALVESADGVSMGDGAPFAGRIPVTDGIGDLIPRWTEASWCAAHGAPSNWLHYTPWRQLEGLGTNGLGRVTASYVRVVTTNSGVATMPFVDVWGEPGLVSGTNGQMVLVIVTNYNIVDGFTHLDYGWTRVEHGVSLLAWPVLDYGGSWYAEGLTNASPQMWGQEECYAPYGDSDNNPPGTLPMGACSRPEINLAFQGTNDLKADAVSWTAYTEWDPRLSGDLVPLPYLAAMFRQDKLRRVMLGAQSEPSCRLDADTQPEIITENLPSNCVYEVYAWGAMGGTTTPGGEWTYDAMGTTLVTSNIAYCLKTHYVDGPLSPIPPETDANLTTLDDPDVSCDSWPEEPPHTDVWESGLNDGEGGCMRVWSHATGKGYYCNLGSAELMLRPGWRFGAIIDTPALNPDVWSTTSTTSQTSSTTTTSTTSSTTTTCGPPP